MRCEVVAIGTELLLGTVVDSHSAWIGQQLAVAGIDCLRSVRVGDNHDRMVAALRESLERADAVICCGGLGPTQDDVTREAIAEVMGVELVRDEAVARVIRDLFAARGRRMAENNLRQADVRAMGDVTCLEVDREGFRMALARHPVIVERVRAILAERAAANHKASPPDACAEENSLFARFRKLLL